MPTQNCGMPWPSRVKARTSPVAHPARRGRCERGERDADHQREHQRVGQQGQRDRDGLGDQVEHRSLVGEAGAQVALEQAAEEEEVLVPQRLVQAELVCSAPRPARGWPSGRGWPAPGCPAAGGP